MPVMADEGKEPWEIPDPDYKYKNEDFTIVASLKSVRSLKTDFYERIENEIGSNMEALVSFFNPLNQIEGCLLKVAAEKAGKGSKEAKEYQDYIDKTKMWD